MAKQRIEYLDLAKGVCVALVVIFHAYGSYGQYMPLRSYVLLFMLQLFYVLSGAFFSTYSGWKEFLVRKVNNLLVPFLFFYLTLSCIVPWLIARTLGIDFPHLSVSEFATGFLRTWFPNVAVWFLIFLFVMQLAFYLVVKLSRCGRWGQAGAVLVVVGLAVLSFVGPRTWMHGYARALCENLAFMAVGYAVAQHTDLLKPDSYRRCLWLQALVAFALTGVAGQDFCPQWVTVYVGGLAGTYGVLALSKWLTRLPLLSYMGRYSLMILSTHTFLMLIVMDVLAHTGLSDAWRIGLLGLIILLLTYAVVPVLRRWLPHVTALRPLLPIPHKRS